jgi:hypothetical protein
MMKHTFTGLVPSFPNKGIHFLITEALTFRKQLTIRDEFRSQSGWNDAMNGYIKRQLEALAQTVKRITYSPSGSDPDAVKDQRIQEAKDTSLKLADVFDGTSINSDDLVMPSTGMPKTVPFELSGNHPDFPQPTHDIIENDFARTFVIGLDSFIVSASQLDSRTQPSTINAMESAQLQSLLNELYFVAEIKGGEENRVETPTGLMPSDRPGTYNYDGSLDINPADPASGGQGPTNR